MTHTPIVHTSIAGAREFYRLRRLGFDHKEAHKMSKQQFIRFENCRFMNSVAYWGAA